MYNEKMSFNEKVIVISNILITGLYSFKLDYEDYFAMFIIKFDKTLYSDLRILSERMNFVIYKETDEIRINIDN